MDTPERNQIGTPLSKFEDSPVFNYINSLSPIKPVKSLHITQAFSSISFASLPSIFSSPHVSAHKESRFLRRHCISDPSKPECSSENENGNEGCKGEGVVLYAAEQYNKSAMLHENFDTAITVGEASAEQDNDDSNFVIELPQNLKYDCGSPDCESAPSGIQMDSVVELDDQFASLVPYVQETSQKGSSDGEAQVQETCLIEQKHDPAVRDWEGLICDTSDLLIFTSPSTTESLKGLMQTSSEPVRRFYDSVTPQLPPNGILDEENMHSSDLVNYSEQQKAEDISSQPGEAVSLEQTEQVQGPTAITCLNNYVVSKNMDGEAETCTEITCMSVLNLHRGLRRRCLDFDQAGGRRKNFGNGSTSNSSSISSQSDEIIILSDKQLVQFKPGGDSRCILPGIGLHLNALASNSKNYRKPNNENLSCGSHPGTLSTTTAYHPNTADQEHLHKSGTSDCSEIDTDIEGNGVQLMHDLDSKEFNQNSPKKKRRKIENVGDSEMACKRCNCKKSNCLKLYCECFAAGLYCTEPCSCQDCFNKPIHEDTVLATRKQIESRNPLAFAPKVIRSSDSVPEYRLQDESSKTPASARHKRGCNCKKSNCLKKYCECYQGGVGCSIGCRCEGCKNAFGRKDVLTGIEAEPDEDETEACEKNLVDKPEIPNNREQNPSASLPITPLRLSRQLVPLSFSSKGKPPRSSFLTITSSSGLYGGQKLGKPNIQQSHPKFLKKMQSAPEDEMPEILRGDCSPSTGIKTSSPNSKRISPPQCDTRSSPARRSGRKLILQSIPSFPSLTLTPRH